MYVGMELHLDHVDDESGRWLGLAHAACNTRAGQRQTAVILRAKGYRLTAAQLKAVRVKYGQAPARPPEGRRRRGRW